MPVSCGRGWPSWIGWWSEDGFETETAAFWYDSPEAKSGELDPKKIKTEIFFLPAAFPGEKEGTFTNTQRLIQYHDKARGTPRRLPVGGLVLLPPGTAAQGDVQRTARTPGTKAIQELTWGLIPPLAMRKDPSIDPHR